MTTKSGKNLRERERERVCVSERDWTVSCVSGVCEAVTAGNQAGMDLVSWGCGGSAFISNDYN